MTRTPFYMSIMVGMLLVVSLFAFQDAEETKPNKETAREEIHPLVLAAVEEKLLKFRNTILEKCRQEAIDAAELFVDSLVAVELKVQSADTLGFPAKPSRPTLSQPVILNDSTEIAPILDQ